MIYVCVWPSSTLLQTITNILKQKQFAFTSPEPSFQEMIELNCYSYAIIKNEAISYSQITYSSILQLKNVVNYLFIQ